MSQSEWLGAMLIVGFIVWLAMTKRLAVYWSILTGGAAQPSPPATSSTATTPSSGVTSGPSAPAGDPPTVTSPPSTTSQQPFRIEIPVPMFPALH